MMDFYTKSEIDEKFGVTISSPSWRDLYTKTEIDANVGTPETLVLPAGMLDFYTKAEIDSVPEVTPEYSDTDKATVILLDSDGNRTDQIQQFSALNYNPVRDVKNFLNGNSANKYDVVLGKDFMENVISDPATDRIQNNGFQNCANIVNLEIYCTSTGNGTTYVNCLGSWFCKNCTSLKRVVLPPSLRHLYYGEFQGCTLLDEIKFPSGLETIESSVFIDCTSIQKFEIPASVTSISKYAFGNCSALQEIVIDKPQDSIPDAPWTWYGGYYGGFNPADVTVTWTG